MSNTALLICIVIMTAAMIGHLWFESQLRKQRMRTFTRMRVHRDVARELVVAIVDELPSEQPKIAELVNLWNSAAPIEDELAVTLGLLPKGFEPTTIDFGPQKRPNSFSQVIAQNRAIVLKLEDDEWPSHGGQQ